MDDKLNLFQGNTSIKDFVHPSKAAYLPLVEISAKLNPFATMHNVKAIPIYSNRPG